MSGMRLGGVVLLGGLLTACGPTHVTTSDSGGGSGGSGGGHAGGASSSSNAGRTGSGGSGTPTPPPAQGATTFFIGAVSPAPAGKQCPVGAALSSAIPDLPSKSAEWLDADTYLHHVVDGEDGVVFKCKVVGTAAFTFAATISAGSQRLIIEEGLLSDTHQGTAKVTLTDARSIATSLVSSAPCVVNAKAGFGNNFQVRAGSIWGSFSCPTVESAPSDLCKADGFFVLENCDEE